MVYATIDGIGPSDAARRLGLSKSHVLRLADHGKLDAVRTPLGRVISRESVERLLEERMCRL